MAITDLNRLLRMCLRRFRAQLNIAVVFIERLHIVFIFCLGISHNPVQFAVRLPELFPYSVNRRGYQLIKLSISADQKFNVLFCRKQVTHQHLHLMLRVEWILYYSVSKEGYGINDHRIPSIFCAMQKCAAEAAHEKRKLRLLRHNFAKLN